MQRTTVGKAGLKHLLDGRQRSPRASRCNPRSSPGDCVEAPDAMTVRQHLVCQPARSLQRWTQRANGTKGDPEAPVRRPGEHVRDERHRAR